MAIYWIDYSASSNGSGTYASPYNGTQGISATQTEGDEIRIKSHSLAALTAFTFTATFTTTTSNYASAPYLEVSDASLFTVGDICMYDAHKTCFRVKSIDTASSPNRIYTGSDFSFRPVHAWNVTNGSFRRINPIYYASSSTTKYLQFTSYLSTNSCTVSDGWYSETARVTDKSYMTIIGLNQTTNSNTTLYIKYLGHGSTISLTNTCCVAQWDRDFQVKDVFARMNNTTMTFHNLWGGRYNGGFYAPYSYAGTGNSLTVDYLFTYYGFSGSSAFRSYGDTLQVNNHTQYSTYMNTRDNPSGNTYIQGHIITSDLSSGLLDYSYSNDWTYVFNGRIEGATSSTPTCLVFGGTGVTLGSGFGMGRYYYNNTPTEISSISKCFDFTNISTMDNDLSTPPTFTNNSSFAFSSSVSVGLRAASTEIQSRRGRSNKARVHDATLIYNSADIHFDLSFFTNTSTFVKNINPVSPEEYELLSVNYRYGSLTNGIKITKDTSFYKTTSPSLKCNLQSFSTSYSNMEFVKVIDLPVAGDGTTQFTVSGWVKSDSGMFASGKLKAQVVYDDTSKATETINISSAEAGWTQFSIAFTPADKQLAQFQLLMHPQAGVKSVWLSDVGVA